MTNAELVERVKKLDRLYLAAEAARDAWLRDPNGVNWRRYRFLLGRYEALVADYERWKQEATP